MKIVIIGGGAAGFFGALACAQAFPQHTVTILEKARQVLAKVRISGGGRCNVTHACFDPAILVQHYPRGNKALRGPFSRFQPRDTITWFAERGVELKVEEDGRMFPTTDNSETIIQCFLNETRKIGVGLRTECGVENIEKTPEGFMLTLSGREPLLCDRVMVTTGSHPKMCEILASLGHTLIPPVPSLFTFNIDPFSLAGLEGVSVPKAHVKLAKMDLDQRGPVLITHWGLSGPAVLKLSAWGARLLHKCGYEADAVVNWLPDITAEALKQKMLQQKRDHPIRQIASECPFVLPKQLWKRFVQMACADPDQRWATVTKKELQTLQELLQNSIYPIRGKTTYKQEFVTSGGVSLTDVNFKTMESLRCPGLYFAGELLDIDGITGGFNFQNAWTTAWIAGHAIGLEK
jgi:predicted Rossmann fold flavoprotein